MLDAQSTRTQRNAGVHERTYCEIASILVVLVAILLFLSLVSQRGGFNLVGQLGGFFYLVLTFVFGKYVSHVVPALTFVWGIMIWRGQAINRVPARILGIFLAALSICSLASIRYADADLRSQTDLFRIGGALGNFVVHQQCLHLRGYVGTTGAYLLLSALLLISVSLITDQTVSSYLAMFRELLGRLREFDWSALLDFRRLFNLRGAVLAESDRLAFQSAPMPAYNPPSPPPMPRTPRRVEPAERAPRQPKAAAAEPERTPPPAPPVEKTKPSKREPEGRRANVYDMPDSIQVDDLVTLAERETAAKDTNDYRVPGLEQLNLPPRVEQKMSRDEIVEVSEILEKTLTDFGISAQVVQVTQGPTVTRFELQPAPGVKVSRIAALENDIAMCMKAESVRIIAPIPGKAAVGLEVPNRKPTPVFLRELLATDSFRSHKSPLAFALGKTISGEPYICDLAAMPHVLIAGTTGSGKSVCLNSIICSILFRMSPEQVKFIMIDPKRVELNVYQAIPHLLAPVVCEPRKAAAALAWAIEQMEDRYKKLASLGVRNIDGYNAIVRSREPHPKAIGRNLQYMQHIVIVVDELADLMIIARNEVEDSIIRLAQMSRAVGMHLIIATQRPSVNVITGIIKANFPCRVAFQVSSKVDSRTILDTNGAEALLGRGDMLFSPSGCPKPIRLQGCYVSDEEVERVANHVREQQMAMYVKQDFATEREIVTNNTLALDGIDADESSVPLDDTEYETDYNYTQQRADGRDPKEILARSNAAGTSHSGTEDGDAIDEELFRQAVRLILVHKKASVSLLQRKLKIGFARAGRLMDMIEEAGIVGPNVGSKVREITVDPEEYLSSFQPRNDQGY